MGKLFLVTAEVRFQGQAVSSGSALTYVRLTDRIGPIRLYHRAEMRTFYSPPPAPPFAPGYVFPPNPPAPPAPPPPPPPPTPPPPTPPYYPPGTHADNITYTWPPPSPPLSPPSPPPSPPNPPPPPTPPSPPPPRWDTFDFHPPACVDSVYLSFTRKAMVTTRTRGNTTTELAWEKILLSSQRFEGPVATTETDPHLGYVSLESTSRVSTTVPVEVCDNPFVSHEWRLVRAPDAVVPVPYVAPSVSTNVSSNPDDDDEKHDDGQRHAIRREPRVARGHARLVPRHVHAERSPRRSRASVVRLEDALVRTLAIGPKLPRGSNLSERRVRIAVRPAREDGASGCGVQGPHAREGISARPRSTLVRIRTRRPVERDLLEAPTNLRQRVRLGVRRRRVAGHLRRNRRRFRRRGDARQRRRGQG